MRRKNRIIFICCGVAILMAAIVVSVIVGNKKELANSSFEIQFPLEADATISAATKKTYNTETLQASVRGEIAYIYANPKRTDYNIVKQLGFNVGDYSTSESYPAIRWYTKGAGESRKALDIDKYGCFFYRSDAVDTWFPYPFTDEQTIKIAKDFLTRYGLWDDSFATFSIDNTVNQTAEGKTVVARTVHFYQKIEGKDVSGNQRIGIQINGNGEITFVNYNVRKYQSKQEARLLSVEEAIQKIGPGKAYINVKSSAKELIFESVQITYWAENLDYEHIALQPIYVFMGTSINELGENEEFSIAVQANVVK